MNGADMLEAEMRDRLTSLRAENADQRRRLQGAEATIKELRDRLAVAKSGECPICDAKRRADAVRAAKYRRRKGGKE